MLLCEFLSLRFVKALWFLNQYRTAGPDHRVQTWTGSDGRDANSWGICVRARRSGPYVCLCVTLVHVDYTGTAPCWTGVCKKLAVADTPLQTLS